MLRSIGALAALALALSVATPASATLSIATDFTIADSTTGLEWAFCSIGQSSTLVFPGADGNADYFTQCDGVAQTFTWPAAVDAVAAYNAYPYQTYHDWRLPTVGELASLGQDAVCSTNASYFPTTDCTNPYWTSTFASGLIWNVGLGGTGTVGSAPQSQLGPVRLVRGTPFFDPFAGGASAPAISAVSRNGATLSVTANPNAAPRSGNTSTGTTAMYVVMPHGATAPNAAQVFNLNVFSTAIAGSVTHGSAVASTGGTTLPITGLAPATIYDLYLIGINNYATSLRIAANGANDVSQVSAPASPGDTGTIKLTFTVPDTQTITFNTTAPTGAKVGDTYPVGATGGASGNPVVFTIDALSTAGACSVSDSTVTFTGTGTCLVDADQAASATYSAAPQVQQSMLVGKADSTTSLQAIPPTVVVGQVALLTATVQANDSPTGSVSFSDATTASTLPGCNAVALSGGAATCSIATLAVGSHQITASYMGDGNTVGSGSAPTSVSVNQAATTTTLVTPAAITLGHSTSISASVSVNAPGAGTLSGSITVADGGAGSGDSCVITLPAPSCTLTPSSGGTKTLTAIYAPDAGASANFLGSSATPSSLQVNAAASGTALASSANPSLFGQGVTFTASVSAAMGNPSPTGSVDFTDGGAAIAGCTGVALGAGQAVCTTAALDVGSHTLQASYGGDANNQPSSDTLTQTVNAATTTMHLDATPNPVGVGQTVTLSATVSTGAPTRANGVVARVAPATGHAISAPAQHGLAATPVGTVTFFDGTTSLGSRPLDAGGVATLSLSSLTPGAHAISATYAGTAQFLQATAELAVAVSAPIVPAPMLSPWLLVLFGGVLAAIGLRRPRRH